MIVAFAQFNFSFGGGGGNPFAGMGGHGHGGRARREVDNTKLYKTLGHCFSCCFALIAYFVGLTKDADENAIKKAYRKLAMTAHPDKGGDPEKVK